MFNAETGTVVGILNMVFVKGGKEAVLEKPSGISYAIPARHLIDSLDSIARKP
jgi:S1-C subfamily serine protease